MKQRALFEQVELLRVQLEKSLERPSIVVVSSARSGDGSSVVATELARSLDAAAYPTLLVVSERDKKLPSATRRPNSLAEVVDFGVLPFVSKSGAAGCATIHLPDNCSSISRDTFELFARSCRREYRVTVVAADPLLTDPFSALSASAADAILLTVRQGRNVCTEDRNLARQLQRDGLPFLGVVYVDNALIVGAFPSAAESSQRSSAQNVNADVMARREPVL